MKKKIGLLVAIFMFAGLMIFVNASTVRADVKINKKNFVEKDVRKIAKDADKNGDGILQDEEAEAVQSVVVIRQYRGDYTDVNLKGIEHFVNAENLELIFEWLNDNKNYIGVKNFSKIYELKKIKKMSLYNMDSVTTVDVTKFEQLECLELSTMEELDNVKFGTNNKLEEIRLSNLKSMKKIDFSNLTALKKLQLIIYL